MHAWPPPQVLERFKTLFTQVVGLDPGKILPTVGARQGRGREVSGMSLAWADSMLILP